MFWRKKKKAEEPFKGIGEEALRQKVEHTLAHMIADELKIVLSDLKVEIPPILVDHRLPDNYTVDLNVPELKVQVNGIPTAAGPSPVPPEDNKKKELDESIRMRKAQQAQRINEILRTKGERIRQLHKYYWNAYLEADRKGQKDKATKFKHKYEAIEEVINEKQR